MKMNQMFPSNWLAKEDITHPIRATIKAVTQEEIKGESGNETKNILHFNGDVKQMILNRTNAEFLVAAFGDDSDHWLGKTVEIYVDPNVMFGGKRIGGVRVRAVQQQTAWTWPQAIAECAKVGINEQQLKDALKQAGLSAYNAQRDTPTVQRIIDEVSGVALGPPGGDNGEIPF